MVKQNPYTNCLWDGGVRWGLTAKLQKESFLGDKNVLYFNRGGHRVCAIVTTHQTLHLKCVHFTVCKKKKKVPLWSKVCVKPQ